MTGSIDDNQNDIIKEAVRQFVDVQMRGEEPDTDEFVKKYGNAATCSLVSYL